MCSDGTAVAVVALAAAISLRHLRSSDVEDEIDRDGDRGAIASSLSAAAKTV